MIDFDVAHKLLTYCPETGVIRWRVSKRGIAGTKTDKGYINIQIKGKAYPAHRLAWLLTFKTFPNPQIDHINQIRDDNRIVNLREVSNRTNHKNMRLYSTNSSGVCGVHWCKKDSLWASQIKAIDGAEISKSFKSLLDAVCFRKSLEIKFGYHENHGKQVV